jgi:hypothetical protein
MPIVNGALGSGLWALGCCSMFWIQSKVQATCKL